MSTTHPSVPRRPRPESPLPVPAPRWISAIHEAGHIVVGWALGRAIRKASLIPDRCSAGRVTFAPLPGHIDLADPRHRALAEREAMIGLAGVLAARVLLGVRRPETSETDLDMIIHAAHYARGTGRSLETYMDGLAGRVVMLLDLYQGHVEAVAAALIDRGEFSGREIAELLRGAGAGQ